MPKSAATLFELAAVIEALSETNSRLKKVALCADYLAPLAEDDLARAVHLLGAHPFVEADRRRLGLGGAGILEALASVSSQDVAALRAQLTELGDFTALARAVVPQQKPTLLLKDVTNAFVDIAAASRPAARKEKLAELLMRADAKEARVIAGVVANELRIGLKHNAIEAAVAQILGVDVNVVQYAHMLRGDLGEVAVLGRRGELDTVAMRLFAPLQFMLATPIEIAAASVAQLPKPFVAEDKFDGIRVQVHIASEPLAREGQKASTGGTDKAQSKEADMQLAGQCTEVDGYPMRVALFSRTHDDVTQAFAELVEPLARLALESKAHSGLILDGELLAMRDGRALPFITLQRRLGRKAITKALRDEVPVVLVAFDVLFDGELLLDWPWHKRHKRLVALKFGREQHPAVMPAQSPMLQSSDALETAFAAARERGHEGLVIKHPDAPYKPGRRGRDWLKMKLPQASFDVVVTAAEVGFGRRHKWLSDYTFAVRTSEADDSLLNVGKAYSGLTDAEIAELTEWFKAHTLQTFAHGRVRIVEPKVVLEVACDRVQPSARHKAGYALRFARIVRIRHDKGVADIDTLETVRKLAELHAGPQEKPAVTKKGKKAEAKGK